MILIVVRGGTGGQLEPEVRQHGDEKDLQLEESVVLAGAERAEREHRLLQLLSILVERRVDEAVILELLNTRARTENNYVEKQKYRQYFYDQNHPNVELVQLM